MPAPKLPFVMVVQRPEWAQMLVRHYSQIKTVLEWLTVAKIALIFVLWIGLFSVVDCLVSNLSSESFIAKNDAPAKDFGDALYFSVVTATTLGYGDVHPNGWLRLSAAIEVL